ncbi:hypothetical protein EDB84DRAFT_1433981 [Lactarius hengduanensis]|nr:hypothetical protein EDB84DRAFT_1433981 [Lactarius hengduanensis]
MTLSLPFSPVSGVDIGQSMENVCQPFEQQGRWPFGADPNADLSAYTRQRPLAIPGGVGVYLTLAQWDQEMASLNEAIIAQQKEFDNLKARYETLDGMHRMMIEQFASEYHELKAASGNGPKPLTLVASSKAQKRGETDGNATTIKKKAKAGRPPKTADDDEDSDSHNHLYLENLDGTLISTASLRKLSSKARSVWFSLADHDAAPPTWGKVSDLAGEYYYRRVLNEPGLQFLQYCDDGLWKLREWTQQSYSGWARNHGVRGSQPRQKNAPEGPEEGSLNDSKLIRMSPGKEDDDTNGDLGNEGHQTDDDTGNEENDSNDRNTHDEEAAETFDGNSTPIPISPPRVTHAPSAPAPSTMATSGATTALTAGSPASATPREATVAAQEATDATPSVAPAEGNNSDTPPSSERAQLGPNNEKKRKPDDKTPYASTKKQKTSAALAIPSDGNSIKGVCMRRWNELQPGGQGLASDFEEYFKALTKADKEPFKKEMRIIQLANTTSTQRYHQLRLVLDVNRAVQVERESCSNRIDLAHN